MTPRFPPAAGPFFCRDRVPATGAGLPAAGSTAAPRGPAWHSDTKCSPKWAAEHAPVTPLTGQRNSPASSGSRWHGSPPSAVLSGRYDFLLSHVLRLIVFASRLRGCLPGFVSALGRSRRRTGPATDRGLDFHAGIPLSSLFAHGQEQDLPGSLAIHPVTLRRSTTPDDPLRFANSGASGAAPTRLTIEGVIIYRFRGCATLRHLLSTLHDGRYRTPCKTRFRLAGCAFAGRESNPLVRYERFQVISSPSPRLSLAQ